MTIPDYQSLMLPLLKFLSDKKEHKIREAVKELSNEFNLSEEERQELLPSGQQSIIHNRICWAKTYILKAGLLFSHRRGHVKISDKGLEVLKSNPKKINIKFLEQFPEFIEFRTIRKENLKDSTTQEENFEEITPDELMEKGYDSINANLTQELLEKLRSVDPYFFEQIVADLLSAMNYGKSKVTKKSGDGGIDGEVNQDKLGLDKIFFQAKRYAENNFVTASNVRDFVGTLDLHGVNKGIFITTSRFPNDTKDILNKTPKNIVLIDGTKLAKLMIEHNIGVNSEKVYEIKKIDSDFFPEE
jgi:restriction system protein